MRGGAQSCTARDLSAGLFVRCRQSGGAPFARCRFFCLRPKQSLSLPDGKAQGHQPCRALDRLLPLPRATAAFRLRRGSGRVWRSLLRRCCARRRTAALST